MHKNIAPHEVEEPKHGQGLRAQIERRRAELDVSLAELQNSEQQGRATCEAIEAALAQLDALLPPDLDHISPVIASQLAHWLETNKHLGVVGHRPRGRH